MLWTSGVADEGGDVKRGYRKNTVQRQVAHLITLGPYTRIRDVYNSERSSLARARDRAREVLPERGKTDEVKLVIEQKEGAVNGSRMDIMMSRLNCLERQNRCLKFVGTMMLIGIVAVLLMGQASPKKRTIEAEGFLLKDTSGNTRATLRAEPDGLAALTLQDKNETPRATLFVSAEGAPRLVLFDKNLKQRTSISTTPDGAPALTLQDNGGTNRARLSVLRGELPALILQDKASKARAQLARLPADVHTLTLTDGNGRQRATLNMSPDGSSGLDLLDESGKIFGRAP